MSVIDRAFNAAFGQKRSADAGTSKLGSSFLDYFFGGGGSVTGPAVNYKSSLKLSAVYNAVNMKSDSIAIIPFGVYKTVPEGRERQKQHPVDWILNHEPDGSNGFLTAFIFKKLIDTSLELRGNCLFAILSDGAGRAVLRYIPWDDVQDIKFNEKTYSLTYHIKGGIVLLSGEVLHFKNLSLDGIVGLSVIQYACHSLGVALEVQQFSYTNFSNKGVRQGVIETEKALPTQKEAIRAGWRSAMQDKNPDRIVILDEGLTFKPIMLTPQEAQIIESARFSIEDIARWFNMPVHKLKSLQQSTNNNIEQQSLEYITDTIQPVVTNIEQEFAKKLFTNAEKTTGYYVKGNMSVILRANMKDKSEYYRTVMNGIYKPNEIRALEEMNAVEGGDELRFQVNTQTQSQIDNQNNNGDE